MDWTGLGRISSVVEVQQYQEIAARSSGYFIIADLGPVYREIPDVYTGLDDDRALDGLDNDPTREGIDCDRAREGLDGGDSGDLTDGGTHRGLMVVLPMRGLAVWTWALC